MRTVDDLLRSHALISDQVDRQELDILLKELEHAIGRESGAVVEFGCYVGTTSLFIRRLLDIHDPERDFHVYDSFAGLPGKDAADHSPAGEQFREGELYASKKNFLLHFKKAQLRPPVVHKGWFDQLDERDVPSVISFAFLDGDYYRSIKDPLRLIGPRLSEQAVIVVDDYANEALPGARRAVDEWLHQRDDMTLHVEHSLAIIRRQG